MLDVLDRAPREDIAGFLRFDDVLQDQAGAVLGSELSGVRGHYVAGIEQTERAKDGPGGELAGGAVDHLGADDVNRHRGSAQHGFGNRPDQQFADGARRVRAHHDAVDFTLLSKSQDLVRSQTGAHHHLAAEASGPGAIGQGFKVLHLGTRGGGVVVVANARGL